MPEAITDVATFENEIKSATLSIIHFSADWAEQCKQINDLFDALSKDEFKDLSFYNCQAEDLTEISFKYNIEAVPTVLLFKSGKEIDRVDGADVAKITSKIKQHVNEQLNGAQGTLDDRLKALINLGKVVLFMKGDRNTPKCGFSRQMIEILNSSSVSYETFDILTDEEVRQGLKKFSDWPTYPQLYVNGELIGGLDIVKEIQAGGELITTLNA